MTKMHSLSGILVTGILVSVAANAIGGSLWETDYEKAAAEAKASHKYMLLDFSGSDWCGWCIKLEKEVFDEKEFKDYAKENLVCVLLDFPRTFQLKKSLREQNEKMIKQYKVSGFPTVLVLSPDAGLVQRTGYQAGGAEKYVEHLKQIIDPHRKANNVPEPASTKGAPSGGLKLAPAISTRRPAGIPEDENRELRTWTARSGSTIEASLIKEAAGAVVLKQATGGRVTIALHQLSEADQAYVKDLKAALAADDKP